MLKIANYLKDYKINYWQALFLISTSSIFQVLCFYFVINDLINVLINIIKSYDLPNLLWIIKHIYSTLILILKSILFIFYYIFLFVKENNLHKDYNVYINNMWNNNYNFIEFNIFSLLFIICNYILFFANKTKKSGIEYVCAQVIIIQCITIFFIYTLMFIISFLMFKSYSTYLETILLLIVDYHISLLLICFIYYLFKKFFK